MDTIISKIHPPTDSHDFSETYQRRDGNFVRFRFGGGWPSAHARAAELGGCLFCLGLIEFESGGRVLFGSSHPRYYRFPCEPCAECAPKLERLNEIDKQISALKEEASSIEYP